MNSRLFYGIMCLLTVLTGTSQVTLEQCQQAAEANYPLIRQYDLINLTTAVNVSNIGKSWLPQVTASAQATMQSDVPAWPDEMKSLINQFGVDIKGLKKNQYRVGIDVSQVVYDGGSISSRQEVARQQGAVEMAQTEVNLYAIRQRVNEMYFGLLLIDEQLQLKRDLVTMLTSNETKLRSLYNRGTVAECDYHAVKAERMIAEQELTSLQSQRQTLARLLSVFCGITIDAVAKPPETNGLESESSNRRPELKLFDSQLRLTDAQERLLNSQLLPQLSVFAQGFYGYPGYNLFDDMMRHRWSLGGMLGARLTWNLGALYTRKNDKTRLALQRATTENNREVFLFNNKLEQTQERETIERYRQMLTTDQEIIGLRTSVRKAAESKLSHGIIDVSDLVKEINAENAARLQFSIHQIEMLKQMYDLRYSTNQ